MEPSLKMAVSNIRNGWMVSYLQGPYLAEFDLRKLNIFII